MWVHRLFFNSTFYFKSVKWTFLFLFLVNIKEKKKEKAVQSENPTISMIQRYHLHTRNKQQHHFCLEEIKIEYIFVLSVVFSLNRNTSVVFTMSGYLNYF